jgi:hypothetical protein
MVGSSKEQGKANPAARFQSFRALAWQAVDPLTVVGAADCSSPESGLALSRYRSAAGDGKTDGSHPPIARAGWAQPRSPAMDGPRGPPQPRLASSLVVASQLCGSLGP